MCDIRYGGVQADLEVFVAICVSELGTLNTSNSKKNVVVLNFSRTLERRAGKLLTGRSTLQCLCIPVPSSTARPLSNRCVFFLLYDMKAWAISNRE